MKFTVLIADSDLARAEVLASVVTAFGHAVIAAAVSSLEAAEAARKCPPDLVLAARNLADGDIGECLADDLMRRHGAVALMIPEHPAGGPGKIGPENAFAVVLPMRHPAILDVLATAERMLCELARWEANECGSRLHDRGYWSASCTRTGQSASRRLAVVR